MKKEWIIPIIFSMIVLLTGFTLYLVGFGIGITVGYKKGQIDALHGVYQYEIDTVKIESINYIGK